MKIVIALAALIALAVAAPPSSGPDGDAVILKHDSDNIGVDGYSFEFQTSNQIAHKEVGRILNPGTDQEENSVQGEYSYPGPNGPFVVQYTADKDGFHPVGDHLPK